MLTSKTKLQTLRERNRLRVENIAVELGVSAATVRSWEAARYIPTVNIWDLDRWLNLYQCSLKELTEAVIEIKTLKEQEVTA